MVFIVLGCWCMNIINHQLNPEYLGTAVEFQDFISYVFITAVNLKINTIIKRKHQQLE